MPEQTYKDSQGRPLTVKYTTTPPTDADLAHMFALKYGKDSAGANPAPSSASNLPAKQQRVYKDSQGRSLTVKYTDTPPTDADVRQMFRLKYGQNNGPKQQQRDEDDPEVQSYIGKYLTGEARNSKSQPFLKLSQMLNAKEAEWPTLMQGYSPLGQRALRVAARMQTQGNVRQWNDLNARATKEWNEAYKSRQTTPGESWFARMGKQWANADAGPIMTPAMVEGAAEGFNRLPQQRLTGRPISQVEASSFFDPVGERVALRQPGAVAKLKAAGLGFGRPTNLAMLATSFIPGVGPWFGKITAPIFAAQGGEAAIHDIQQGDYTGAIADTGMAVAPFVLHKGLESVAKFAKRKPGAAPSSAPREPVATGERPAVTEAQAHTQAAEQMGAKAEALTKQAGKSVQAAEKARANAEKAKANGNATRALQLEAEATHHSQEAARLNREATAVHGERETLLGKVQQLQLSMAQQDPANATPNPPLPSPVEKPIIKTGITDFHSLRDAIGEVKPELSDDARSHTAVLVETLARGSSKELGLNHSTWYQDNIAGLVREADSVAQKLADDFNAQAAKEGQKPRAEAEQFQGFTQRVHEWNAEHPGSEIPTMSVDDSRQVISILATANASTIPHEALGHVFLRQLEREAGNGNVTAQTDLQRILKWAGVETVADAHEPFADGYEGYLKDGKAPHPSLNKTFALFKTWLENIYHTVKTMAGGKKETVDILNAKPFSADIQEMMSRYHGDVSDIVDQIGKNKNAAQMENRNSGRTTLDQRGAGGGQNPDQSTLHAVPGTVGGRGDSGDASRQAGGPAPTSGATGLRAGSGGDTGGVSQPVRISEQRAVDGSPTVSGGGKRVSVTIDGKQRSFDLDARHAVLWDSEVARYKAEQEHIKNTGSSARRQARLKAAAFKHAEAKRAIARSAAESAPVRETKAASVLPTDEPATDYSVRNNSSQYEIEPAEPSANRKTITATGKESTVYTPSTNKPVRTKYAVVEADDLIPSQTDTLAAHPDYDQSLQPRDRTRVASLDQVDRIARTITPERLGGSSSTAEGAPIVGPDGQVESGNGRALAIRRAYAQYAEKGESYKQWIADNAESLGLDPATVSGMKKPVLVRVRDGEMSAAERSALASEMGASPVAARSETEIAVEDGKRLRDSGLVNRVAPGAGGDLNTTENVPFIREFMKGVPENERGALVQEDGRLSAQGLRRVRNAILSAAYDDPATITRLAESTDDNVRGVGSAMVATAPRLAKLKTEIGTGDRYPVDITADIAAAASKLSDLRKNGTGVDEHLAQVGMFGEDLSPTAKLLLKAFDDNKRAPNKIGDILRAYADSVDAVGSPKQISMFDDAPVISSEVILKGVLQRQAEKSTGTAPLFQRRPQSGLITRLTSQKTGETNLMQSSYEAVRAAQLDANPSVKNWYRNKTGIPYLDPETGKMRMYYPDYVVEYNDGRTVVEEIKPKTFVDKATIQAKAAAAKAYYAKSGTEYKFITEDTLTNSRINKARAAIKSGKLVDEKGNPNFQRRVNGAPAPMKPPVPPHWLQNAATIYKAGLLSWLPTHFKNVIGNTSMQASEEISRGPASMADIARVAAAKAVGGDTTALGRVLGTNRTVSGISLPAVAAAGREGATQGIKEAGEIMKKGKVENDRFTAPIDAQKEAGQLRELATRSPLTNAMVNGVFRLLSASDRVFRTYAFRRSLEGQASLILEGEAKAARQSGKPLSPADIATRRKDLIQNPSEAMIAQAIEDAEVSTFNNSNRLSTAYQSFKRGIANPDPVTGKVQNPLGVAALDVASPFTGTPTNVAARQLEYIFGTVIAPAKAAGQIRADLKAEAAGTADRLFDDAAKRDFAKTFGRGVTGASLMAMGYALADKGLITGGDTGASDRKKRDDSGIPANSIKVGDTWVKIDIANPAGTLLLVGATLREQSAKGERLEDKLNAAGAAVVGSVGNAPLVSGVPQFDAIKEGRLSQVAGAQLSSFIPSGVRGAAQMLDEGKARDTSGGLLDPVMASVPLLRSQLPEKPGKKPSGNFGPLNPFSPVKGGTANPNFLRP